MPDTLDLPQTRLSAFVDRSTSKLLGIVSWTWPALILVVMLNVLMRYLFSEGRIEFEEIQ